MSGVQLIEEKNVVDIQLIEEENVVDVQLIEEKNVVDVKLIGEVENTNIHYGLLVNVKTNANDDTPEGLANRIAELEEIINAIRVYNFSVNIDLIDNIEESYVVNITGISESKNYYLSFNSNLSGLSASLKSWADNELEITVVNNTGTRINTSLNFKINELL